VNAPTLAALDRIGLRLESQVSRERALLPYPEIDTPTKRKDPPAWYKALQAHEWRVIRGHHTHDTSFGPPLGPRPENLPQPRKSAEVFTDGSLLSGGKGGYAAISFTHIDGWGPLRSGAWGVGSGASRVGAEPLSIDTLELLAAIAAMEHAPDWDLVIYHDASYISRIPLYRNTRRQVRSLNRGLWIRFLNILDERTRRGVTTKFVKCTAHGRDLSQEARISEQRGSGPCRQIVRLSGPARRCVVAL
jgi:ribonuclease HI